jgi:hypothetical protein
MEDVMIVFIVGACLGGFVAGVGLIVLAFKRTDK